jgi:transcriptional regulator with XRE-family HTH domain
MSAASTAFSEIDRHVAANLRYLREKAGLSQGELAQRMSDHGFGFTQATVWKIESGQRPVKLSEAVALSHALQLSPWINLVAEPEVTRHQADLTAASRRVSAAHDVLKEAAKAYLQEQINLSYSVRAAQDAGIAVNEVQTSWLDIPAERVVIEARVASDHEEEVLKQQDDTVNAIMEALREHGYEPPRPEAWVESGKSS